MISCQIIIVIETSLIKYKSYIGTRTDILNKLSQIFRFSTCRLVDISVNKVCGNMAISFQFTISSIILMFMIRCNSCSIIPTIVISCEYKRIYVEYTFTCTIFPVCSLVSKFLFRSNYFLSKVLSDITYSTYSIYIFNFDIKCRRVVTISIILKGTYSCRVHSPYQIV